MYSRIITETEIPSLIFRLEGHSNLIPATEGAPVGGVRLGESRPQNAARALSSDEEQFIANRIAVWRLEGANERLIDLIIEMQKASTLSVNIMQTASTLSVNTKERISQWIKQFLAIDVNDKESLSIALAFLIIKILRPAVGGEGWNEQNLLVDWEEACYEILSLFLSNRDAESFINERQNHFTKEDLLKNICAKADEVLKLLGQTFERRLLNHNQLIDDAYQIYKQRLSSLQENRQHNCEVIVASMNLLIEEIDQLALLVMSSGLKNTQDLCQELAIVQTAFDNQLKEYKRVIQSLT